MILLKELLHYIDVICVILYIYVYMSSIFIDALLRAVSDTMIMLCSLNVRMSVLYIVVIYIEVVDCDSEM